MERSLGGERSALPLCLSRQKEAKGRAPLARSSRWHGTKAGSEVAEMSTERQTHTHTEPSSESFNP